MVAAVGVVWASGGFQTRALGAEELEGRASVVDGDTIEIRGQRVRLFGIDAPEASQRCGTKEGKIWLCGSAAAWELDVLVRDRTVFCDVRDKDRYRRLIAVCRVGNIDLGAALVESGWAVAYQKYSKDYVELEDAAKRTMRGIWAGEFERPDEFRRNGKQKF